MIASRRRRERPHPQHAAVDVDRSRDMHIEMRIDTTDHRSANFYDGHLPSLLSLNWSRGGTHVPGRRPWRAGCSRSPLDHPPERGVPRYRSRQRTDHQHQTGGPTALAHHSLTGQSVRSRLWSDWRVDGHARGSEHCVCRDRRWRDCRVSGMRRRPGRFAGVWSGQGSARLVLGGARPPSCAPPVEPLQSSRVGGTSRVGRC